MMFIDPTDKRQEIWLCSLNHNPLIADMIRFVPVRGSKRNHRLPGQWFEARAILMNGKEYRASCNDISLVADRQFFQNETEWIGYNSLVKWINGEYRE